VGKDTVSRVFFWALLASGQRRLNSSCKRSMALVEVCVLTHPGIPI